MRTAFDFSPLYRSTVGFDRLFDMLDQATRVEPMTNWPPYNIEKVGEDSYRIVMAVAGFKPEALDIVQRSSASGARRSREWPWHGGRCVAASARCTAPRWRHAAPGIRHRRRWRG